MANTLDWAVFLKLFVHIYEACFCFVNESNDKEHWLGISPGFDKPYWIGYCDVPDGKEYSTAEDLVNDKVFDGKSLKERWEAVQFLSINGENPEDWLKKFD